MEFWQGLKFNFKITLLVGLMGGLFFGLYDFVNTILVNNLEFLSFADFFDFGSYIFLISVITAVLGMVILGNIIFLLSRFREFQFNKRAVIALQFGIFILIVSTLITGDILNISTTGSPNKEGFINIFYTLFFSVLPTFGAGMLIYFLLGYYSKKRIFAFLAIFLILMICLSWFLLKGSVHKFYFPELAIEGQKKPNILWIVLDAGRADHFSCYDYSKDTTPYIDSIAQEGVIYKNAISAAPWTVPSHASMFTGLFPSQHGADGAWKWLGEEFVTIAELLKDQGYQTLLLSNNENLGPGSNLNQGFNVFIPFRYRLLLSARTIKNFHNFLPGLDFFYQRIFCDVGAEQTNKLVRYYLDNFSDKNRPFFMFINYMEVHHPYGNSPFADRYLNSLGLTLKESKLYREKKFSNINQYFARKSEFSDSDKEVLNALYDGDLSYLDFKINELVSYFRQRDILDNTILIISSDHGENLGERNMINHLFDIHRTLVHVPLIIRYPKILSSNRIEQEIVQTTDIFPTILDIVGIDDFDKKSIQGISLLEKNRSNFAVSEARFKETMGDIRGIFRNQLNPDQRFFGGVWKNIQTSEYEYIVENSRAVYLYNLKNDPKELNNISELEPGKTKEMNNKLLESLNSFQHYWEPFYF